jgi:DNA-binding transcriptional regulator YiaG
LARKRKRQTLPPPSKRRAIRTRAGVSLVELGQLVGVSGEAVRLWERGERRPSEPYRDDYIEVLDQLRAG